MELQEARVPLSPCVLSFLAAQRRPWVLCMHTNLAEPRATQGIILQGVPPKSTDSLAVFFCRSKIARPDPAREIHNWGGERGTGNGETPFLPSMPSPHSPSLPSFHASPGPLIKKGPRTPPLSGQPLARRRQKSGSAVEPRLVEAGRPGTDCA